MEQTRYKNVKTANDLKMYVTIAHSDTFREVARSDAILSNRFSATKADDFEWTPWSY